MAGEAALLAPLNPTALRATTRTGELALQSDVVARPSREGGRRTDATPETCP
jgi:hypothetical protein